MEAIAAIAADIAIRNALKMQFGIGGREMIDVTTETYDAEVLKSEGLTLVDFWAEWCGPCKMTAPVLDAIDKKWDNVKVCKVNVDQNQPLAERYMIMSIPTMLFYKNGEKVHELIGFHSQEQLEAELTKFI